MLIRYAFKGIHTVWISPWDRTPKWLRCKVLRGAHVFAYVPAKEHAHAHMVVAYVNDIGNLSSTGLLLTCAIISSTSLNADAYIFVVHTQLSHDRNSKVNAQRDVVPKIAMDCSNDFSWRFQFVTKYSHSVHTVQSQWLAVCVHHRRRKQTNIHTPWPMHAPFYLLLWECVCDSARQNISLSTTSHMWIDLSFLSLPSRCMLWRPKWHQWHTTKSIGSSILVCVCVCVFVYLFWSLYVGVVCANDVDIDGSIMFRIGTLSFSEGVCPVSSSKITTGLCQFVLQCTHLSQC